MPRLVVAKVQHERNHETDHDEYKRTTFHGNSPFAIFSLKSVF